MSVHHTQSRPKSDFEQLKVHPSATLHHPRSHPPRLQHSPSLPNIRFPPHSGPLPAGISAAKRITQAHLHRPPTPPAPVPSPPPQTPHMTTPDSHNGIVSGLEQFSLKDDTIKDTPLDTRKRRRDRSAIHHLLTPPLTPSSSINTTAGSVESTDTKYPENLQVLRELQEPTATRYLFLSNISSDLESINLQRAITDALSNLQPRRNTKSLGAADDKSNSSCIKGFFLRNVETTGTLFLAFHDVRDALTASAILPHRCHGLSAEYKDEQQDKSPDVSERLHCRFVTAEELVKTIGNSTFLATNDGDFLLSVTSLNDPSSDPNLQSCGINVHTLIKYLETYGDLRLFMPEKESDGNEQTFSVEFFDVRDANEAYTALDSQAIFGVKLKTSGRVTKESPQVGEVELDDTPSNQDPGRSDTPQWNHQPSASESHIPKLRTPIGPAGEVSQMRGRFICHSKRNRPRAVSVGNEAAASPPRNSDRQPNASPTIFYTSFDLNGSYVNSPFPTQVRNLNEHRTNVPENNGEVIEYNDDNVKNRGELQQSCSIAECRYCPSKYHETSSVQRSYNPPLVNPPFINPINPMPFSMQPPPPVFIGPNEFEGQSQGVFPTPNWLFDPNLLPPAINVDMLNTAYGHAAVPVVPMEHRFLEQNRFMPNPLAYPSMSSTPIPIQTQPSVIDIAVEFDQDIFIDNPAESSVTLDSDANLKVGTTAGQNDRNILNIQRIEDGLDTRTTVMIKNIPNKMTARDLIQYISEVCPRKFDFLYLRMDFKNGCNVGYAFVNFIRVQDMLHFAKERLGIKWNMFSSEKVLQMSYANYQGKEALVEKFKNSCIMDEREEWRPKIFYSSGPEQGLPEPFPAPTHLRRKERSLHNRGALQEYSSGSSKYLEHRRHGHTDRNGVDSLGGGRRNKFNYQPSA